MRTKEEEIVYQQEYRQQPGVMERRRLLNKKYRQTPEAKAKAREYYQRPDVNVRAKERRNSPEVKAKIKSYQQIPENKLKAREYYQRPDVKIKSRAYEKDRKKTNKQFKIKCLLRTRLWKALKLYTTTGKVRNSKQYGIDHAAIIEHLKPFPVDIHLYHIDHIRPLCSFNLEDPEEIKKAFAPENHQWLLAFDNISKGGKWVGSNV